jgi:hypothetical protein
VRPWQKLGADEAAFAELGVWAEGHSTMAALTGIPTATIKKARDRAATTGTGPRENISSRARPYRQAAALAEELGGLFAGWEAEGGAWPADLRAARLKRAGRQHEVELVIFDRRDWHDPRRRLEAALGALDRFELLDAWAPIQAEVEVTLGDAIAAQPDAAPFPEAPSPAAHCGTAAGPVVVAADPVPAAGYASVSATVTAVLGALTAAADAIVLPADPDDLLRRGIEWYAATLPAAAFASTSLRPRRTFVCWSCSPGWMAGQDADGLLSGPVVRGPESAPPPS